jgi:hypothetical protein
MKREMKSKAPVFGSITIPHHHWRSSPPARKLLRKKKWHNELRFHARRAVHAVRLGLFFGGRPFFFGPGGGRGVL